MSRYRKSWTEVIEEVYLGEALKPIDKSVVDAFYYKNEKDKFAALYGTSRMHIPVS